MTDYNELEKEIEKYLAHSEEVIAKAKNQSHSYPFYVAASYWTQRALINQNKIIIELLKEKK
ncbi:MAG: hypothetical protein ACTSPM_00920 [Candidatus Heimdallarchaeota archaeon]